MEKEKHVLAAMALFEEVILDHRPAKLKENQDVNLITESAVLGIIETNKIRELYRTLSEIPETANGGRIGRKSRSCERMGTDGGNSRSG